MRTIKDKIKLQEISDNLNDAETTRYVSHLISKETYVHDVTFLMEYIEKLEELTRYLENHVSPGSEFGWD